MNTKLEILLDWLEFTIKEHEEEFIISQVLKLNLADFTELERGRFGYKKAKTLGNITVLSEGREDMGIHVSLSGKGCREYEVEGNLIELIRRIDRVGGKLTRLDVAIDDKEGDTIDFNLILADIKAGNVVSKWKNSIEIIKRGLDSGKIEGRTLNIGSRTSEIYMRIYDKGLEQQIKEEKSKKIAWTRLEIEIKKKKAEKMQKIIINSPSIGTIISKVINNYIRFVSPSKDKNKSRWKTRPYWEQIVAETERMSLVSKPEPRTIEDVREWLIKQVSPSLALLVCNDEGSTDDIVEMIVNGRHRLKPKHYKMLND